MIGNSESKSDEQVSQKSKKKLKINSSKAKADAWKKCQEGSGGKSEHECK